MDTEDTQDRPVADIPDDAVVVRQSQWSWMLFVVPWAILALVSTQFDAVTFGILPIALAAVVVVPRYVSYRGTAYILTEQYVIIQLGQIGGKRRFDLPIAQVSGLRAVPGYFGRTLGYTGVQLALQDGGRAVLQYVPSGSPLFEHIRTRMPEPPPEAPGV